MIFFSQPWKAILCSLFLENEEIVNLKCVCSCFLHSFKLERTIFYLMRISGLGNFHGAK